MKMRESSYLVAALPMQAGDPDAPPPPPTPIITLGAASPASGVVNEQSGPMVVSWQNLPAAIVITPVVTPGPGTFAPVAINAGPGDGNINLRLTPTAALVHSISLANDGGIANPTPVVYTATPAVTPSLTWVAPSPSTGALGVASGNFTATLVNGAASVTVTPSSSLAGTWAPSSRTLTPGAPAGTFTFTPSAAGSHSASLANNAGIAAPSALTYTVAATPALTWTAPSPASGLVGVASGNFTATLVNGAASVLVTPGASPSGTWTPASRTLTPGSPSGTFTFTPSSVATHSATLANNAGITAPAALSYAASAATPTQLAISGASSGTTGSPTTLTFTLNAPATVAVTVTPTPVAGVTYSTPAVIGIGQTSTTCTMVRAADGSHSVAATTSPGLTVVGGYTFTSSAAAPAPAPAFGLDRSSQPYLFQPIHKMSYPSTLGGSAFNVDGRWAPTYTYVDGLTGWQWTNPGGDWIDAAGTPQGSTPWASFSANLGSTETDVRRYTGINVLTLVNYCFTNAKPLAVILRGTGAARAIAGLFRTASSLATPDSDRPVINVTYADGSTAVLACRIVALDNPSDAVPNVGAASMGLPAFLEFERPARPCTAATLALTLTQHWSGSATCQLFLLNPPKNTEPVTGLDGLAASAGGLDEGLASVPGIIGVQRYVDGSVLSDFVATPSITNWGEEQFWDPALWGGASNTSRFPHTANGKWVFHGGSVPTLVNSSYTGEGFEPLFPGMGALKAVMPGNAVTGNTYFSAGETAVNGRLFMPFDQIGLLGRIFVRQYIRFGLPHDRTEANVVEVLDGGPRWATNGGKFGIAPSHVTSYGGNSGSSGGGKGYQLRWAYQECEIDMDGPLENGVIPGDHLYDFQGNNPVGHRYGGESQRQHDWGQKGGLGGVLYAGRWYCVEKEYLLNTVRSDGTYDADGALRTWIDGKLVHERTGMVFRTLPLHDPGYNAALLRPFRELGIKDLWWNWYNGGLLPATATTTQFMTGLAWGTSRIGPMRQPMPAWAAALADNTVTTLSHQSMYAWAAAGGIPAGAYRGSNPFKIVNAFCDPAIHPINYKQYYYGGGHGDGTCDAVVEFDPFALTWRLVGQPTPPSVYLPNWITDGLTSAKYYPSGKYFYGIPQVGDPPLPAGTNVYHLTVAEGLNPTTDAAYVAPRLSRVTTHMYGGMTMRGDVITTAYSSFGEFNIKTGLWSPSAYLSSICTQLTAFRPQYGDVPLQQGTTGFYDPGTDRHYYTLNPGDAGGGWRSGIIQWHEPTRTIEAIHDAGADFGAPLLNSVSWVIVGREVFYFLKPNGSAGLQQAMNFGFVFHLDNKTMKKFVVTGTTQTLDGTTYLAGNAVLDTVLATYDGRKIRRWNPESGKHTKIHSIDPAVRSGTGTLVDPWVLTQTEMTPTGSFPAAAPAAGATWNPVKRFQYYPPGNCILFLPDSDSAHRALRIND